MVEKVSSWSSAFPVPIATHAKGSSAIWTGKALENEEIFSSMLSEY